VLDLPNRSRTCITEDRPSDRSVNSAVSSTSATTQVESGASQTNVRVGDATPFHQPEVWRVHHPRTSDNLWKTVCPVSVRINLRVVRANTGAPNDSSPCLICELILGCDTCRTSLAFRRLPSFATAQTEGPSPLSLGTIAKFREVMEVISNDRRVFTSSVQRADGKWAKIATISYRRKK
jgi:Protein of unknown function (DUF1579)